MGNFIQDLRYGLRTLVKTPAFAAVAVLTIALGLGANTTIFSVMNATILKRLPFPDPDRLVLVWETFGKGPDNTNIVSAPNFWDWQQQNHVFEGMAIFDSAGRGYNLSEAGAGSEPERVSGLRVSANFFPLLGIKPYLGRTFLLEEETLGKDHEVVLSYGLWERRYGADRTLVGKTIRMDGEQFTVVGVMPRDFQFQFWSGQRQLWVPAGYTEGDKGRDSNSFVCFARLKPGVTVKQARAEMETIGHRLSQQYPKELANGGTAVMPMAEFGVSNLRPAMLALFAAVGFVLLIACVNVANLMLARGATRQKEFAIRRALGAHRFRIARQLLTESVLLAILGGISGLALAAMSTRLLPRILPGNVLRIPFRQLEAIPMDGRVFAFALVISCLTGILFGLAPAFSVFRGDVNEPLKEGSRGSTMGGGSRLRHALVASEVALALVVLSGARLMIESMARVLGVDPGLNPKNVLTMEMSLPQINIYYGPPVHARFCQDLDERVGTLSGVVSVSAIAHLPLGGGSAGRGFWIEGRPDPGAGNNPGANYTVTCPNYIRTMGIPLLEGREFTHQDKVGATDVIVINQAMARKYWPKEDPIGKRIKLDLTISQEPWFTIVGVVGDVRHWGLDDQMYPQFFRPYTQAAWPVMTMVVRTASSPAMFTNPVKKALAEIDPEQPVSRVQTMEEVVSESVGPRRFPMLLLASFALLALALAAVGISGVVGFSVAQRTHEIGIRMALGAQTRDVLRLIVSRSMVWALAGVGVGVAGALGLTRLLAGLLYGVKPTDPVVLGAVSLLLAVVALLASYLPARRATKVDPMVALRYQ